MKLHIHEAAAAEVRHHYDWYVVRDPRVAERLAELFNATVLRIVERPLQFPLMEMRRNPGNIRRAMLKGYPLYVLYRLIGDAIEVFAVPHASQRPGYWKSRLK